MARTQNKPLDWNELVEKRIQLFKFYMESNIQINYLILTDKFYFGKHKGQIIGEVYTDKPEYIEWMIDSTDDKCFKFPSSYNFNDMIINQQHFQLNAIKFEIATLQSKSLLKVIPEIPESYHQLINVT